MPMPDDLLCVAFRSVHAKIVIIKKTIRCSYIDDHSLMLPHDDRILNKCYGFIKTLLRIYLSVYVGI